MILCMTLETIDQYVKRLKRSGVKELGRGFFSKVFAHPHTDTVAVKLTCKVDRRYINYAKKCQQLQENVWLPKVMSINSVRFSNAQRHLIFMERLAPAKAHHVKKAIQQILAGTTVTNTRKFKTFHDFSADIWSRVAAQSPSAHIRELAQIMYRLRPDDLHNGNVMMRGEQLVFTDPVASHAANSTRATDSNDPYAESSKHYCVN